MQSVKIISISSWYLDPEIAFPVIHQELQQDAAAKEELVSVREHSG